MGTWAFTVAGSLIAIPMARKWKSFGPLYFSATPGSMLDSITVINACHEERLQKILESQNSAVNASLTETGADSSGRTYLNLVQPTSFSPPTIRLGLLDNDNRQMIQPKRIKRLHSKQAIGSDPVKEQRQRFQAKHRRSKRTVVLWSSRLGSSFRNR
ncbi:hypothetical protein FEM48_Zijuj06G0125400 [Ziziphus jujuba var. spinosa]|uniref:Uncharacterized protein n=1 Tax=Ziziphus jujuba var. spinosa TaxID=714518 RepID=A0A978V9B0_ZIZJJ|nr:hypothetical protein FEM48_Zijuj06G0125400 [Ziziphus jujuba var. spinosa]